MTKPNKLKCSQLAITFQSSLSFTGNTRALPKKEASERCSIWVDSGLALKELISKLFWHKFTLYTAML
jgi:hypothetical protein